MRVSGNWTHNEATGNAICPVLVRGGGKNGLSSVCQMPKEVHLKVSCCALFPQQMAQDKLTVQNIYTHACMRMYVICIMS